MHENVLIIFILQTIGLLKKSYIKKKIKISKEIMHVSENLKEVSYRSFFLNFNTISFCLLLVEIRSKSIVSCVCKKIIYKYFYKSTKI